MNRLNKRLVLLMGFLFVLFIAFLFFSFGSKAAPKHDPSAVVEKEMEVACSGEGESAGGSCIGCRSCCNGLIGTNSWIHANIKYGCTQLPPPGSGGSCVKCGDGKCDEAHFENRCNCPKDCH